MGKRKSCILIVNDHSAACIQTKELLEAQYEIGVAGSGAGVLEWLETNTADLVLLDYHIQDMNGLEVFRAMKKVEEYEKIPVIFLTNEKNEKLEAELIKSGAADFISRPVLPEVIMSRIDRVIELEHYRRRISNRLDEKSKQMGQVVLQVVMTIANTIDAKDDYSDGHSTRVASYAVAFVRKLGWSEQEVKNMYYLSLLHDIGKIGVSDTILNKAGKLKQDEWEIIKRHTNMGAEILQDIVMVKGAVEGALYHHERFDGTGYPKGLKGEEIPLVARVISIVDAYDAMTSSRIYREKMSKLEAAREIKRCSGTQFDPVLAEAFLELLEEGFPADMETASEFRLFDKLAVEDSIKLLQIILEEKNRLSKNEAMRDSLTGLYNRRYTENQIDKILYQGVSGGTMFMFDLDQFKSVNDQYGHIVGDKVLKSVARLLTEHLGEDDIGCRIGGDEFLIFYYGLEDYDEISRRARRIIDSYRKLCNERESMAMTSISIGISRSGLDGNRFRQLYKAADNALYYVKQNGKNNYHFFQKHENLQQEVLQKKDNIDIQWLRDIFEGEERKTDAYQVDYKEFHRIYQFVSQNIERTGHSAVLALLTMRPESSLDVEEQDFAIRSMEKAIFLSLRKSDISTRLSNTQILVLLNNCSNYNAEIVVERIMKDFYNAELPYVVKASYDLVELDFSKETPNLESGAQE